MTLRAHCRKGDLCSFTVTIVSGLPARYTEARFQVRERFDETMPLLLGVDQSDGITIDYSVVLADPILDERGDVLVAAGATVSQAYVSIGAVATEAMPFSATRPTDLAAQIRFYDPTNDNDRISWPIAFVFLPDAIDD